MDKMVNIAPDDIFSRLLKVCVCVCASGVNYKGVISNKKTRNELCA